MTESRVRYSITGRDVLQEAGESLPLDGLIDLKSVLDGLSADPHPKGSLLGVTEVRGFENLYSVRFGRAGYLSFRIWERRRIVQITRCVWAGDRF